MGRGDSAFGRLAQAWNATGQVPLAELTRKGLRALGLRTAPKPDRVLWIVAPGDEPPPLAVTSLSRSSFNYRITAQSAADPAALAEALRKLHPRLLIVDVEWCEAIGVPALRELHRRAPGTDWLLRWDEPSPRWLDALVACGARGAIDRGAGSAALARALDAVHAGELWLPRQVMKWLYATIVETHASASTAPPSSISSLWPTDSQLTAREAEAAELMRHGLTNREIAERLGVSVNTVKKHLGSAYEKLGIRSRRQVAE